MVFRSGSMDCRFMSRTLFLSKGLSDCGVICQSSRVSNMFFALWVLMA